MVDNAYSSRTIRAQLRRRRITTTVPEPAEQQANRARRGSKGRRSPGFGTEGHKQRNVVERCINKLKGSRAVATRYDKREYIFGGTVDVASIRIWLREPSHDLRDTPYIGAHLRELLDAGHLYLGDK